MAKRIRSKYNTEVNVDSMNIDIGLAGEKRANTEVSVDTMSAEIDDILITPIIYVVDEDYNFVIDEEGNRLINL